MLDYPARQYAEAITKRVCGAPDVDVDGIKVREGKILILANFSSSLKAKLPTRPEALAVFYLFNFIIIFRKHFKRNFSFFSSLIVFALYLNSLGDLISEK